jgi:hypothetical protein
MNIVRWIKAKFELKGRDLQESIDLMKGLSLMSARRIRNESSDSTAEEKTKKIEKLSIDERRHKLNSIILEDVLSMLTTVKDASSADNRKNLPSTNSNPDLFPLTTKISNSDVLELRNQMDGFIKQRIGFVPRCAPSKIPHAGRGVFIDGRCEAGQVVALFPGSVSLPGHLIRTTGAMESLYPGKELPTLITII